jgi:hypothetical protein
VIDARLAPASAAISRDVVAARPRRPMHRRVAASNELGVSFIRTYDPSVRDDDRWAILAGVVVLLAGAALAAARFWGEAPPARDLECAVGAIAFGAVVAAPGVLALLSVHDRPALALPAALVLLPLSFISFALVTLPLLVPAVLLFRRYVRAPGPKGRDAATTFAVALLLVTAGLALFAHEDPRSWTTATESGSTSDVVTYAEAAVAVGLAGAAVAGGWWATRPRQPGDGSSQITEM